MRAFLIAMVVMVVLAVAANVGLMSMDWSAEAVYQTSNVRTGE